MSASWITAITVLGVCALMVGLNLLIDLYFNRVFDGLVNLVHKIFHGGQL